MATRAVSPTAMRSPYDWTSSGGLRDWYFPLLLFLAPVQSVLVTPVQGTTPAFLLTLAAAGVLVDNDRRYAKTLIFYVGFVIAYTLYMALSLSGYTISNPDMSQLTVIREIYIYGQLKQSHLTQGVYLMVALLFCFLVYEYWQEAFVKWAYFGIIALSLYGFYEFIFYALFQQNGDFLSNRNFGDLQSAASGADVSQRSFATGSLLQQSNLFGPGFMRLKSLVGEPSMYALTVTPFAVYAFARRWWLIFALLTVSLVLSTSSTAVIGLVVGLAFVEVRQRQEFILYIGAFALSAVLLYATSESIQRAVDTLIFEKLDTLSGAERLRSFALHAGVVFDGNPIRSLFGLGFGTVRSLDMMSNLLANVGVLGWFAYSALMLGPCFLLRRASDRDAITATLLAIWMMEMLTVSEYAYLPPWFMVAMGYARAHQIRKLSAVKRIVRA